MIVLLIIRTMMSLLSIVMSRRSIPNVISMSARLISSFTSRSAITITSTITTTVTIRIPIVSTIAFTITITTTVTVAIYLCDASRSSS